MTIFNPVYHALYAIGYFEPVHPPLTHITIGVVAAALVFRVLAWVQGQPSLAQAARYCLILAWLFIFPTVLLGFMDWQHWYQGAWLPPILIKISLASFLFLLLSLGMILIFTGREESKALLAIYFIAFFTVAGLGYYGGRLVFGGRAPAAPAGLEAGRRLFENNCMACHPNLGNAVMPDMPIIGSDRLTDLHSFISLIRDPRLDNGQKGLMPDFPPQKISDGQARQLHEYLTAVLQGASHHEH
ncbi:MAG: c-type cytochrome [Deltaproteobacteria bacterium]|nr:c-type cytochrome [Deltaproteobacteria bacterium]